MRISKAAPQSRWRPRAPRSDTYPRQLRALVENYASSWRHVARAGAVGQDLLAGLTVAAVALPLNIGLALASGLPPSAGLIAGAVGGGIAALFGSSQYQVSGPAAALTVMVLALVKQFGTTGVAAATIYIGVIQIALALAFAGKIVRHVPESVLAGFTTGVGLKLLDQQIPELLGFPEVVDWASRGTPTTLDLFTMMHHPKWLHDVSWLATVAGIFVIFVVTAMRPVKRFPSAIISIALITFVAVYLKWDVERVGDVPTQFPAPALPWLADEQWIDLVVQTTPLALLAATESLLSASAIDRMADAKTPHDANVELIGQGLANVVVGFFSGMPVTGVVARSGVNVQSGGKTRLAALMHAIILTCAVLFLGRYISQVPLAALAGLLCVIGVRLIEVNTLSHLFRAHRLEAVAFVVAALGTVSGHLIVGLVAALLIHFANRWLHRHERAAEEELTANRRRGIRAVVTAEKSETTLAHFERGRPKRVTSPLREASATTDESRAVYVGNNVSIARDAVIRGPCFIGDETFVDSQAVVDDSVIGARCFVSFGAVVLGVDIPDGRLVPAGQVVDTMDAVDALPLVGELDDLTRFDGESASWRPTPDPPVLLSSERF